MSDTHWPVYWLAGYRRGPPSQDDPSGYGPNGDRVDIGSPLTVAGTAQFEALDRLSLEFPFNPFGHRCV